MIKIAVLIDLEWSKNSGGHVKFWERICESLEKKKLDIDLELFFLGKKKKKNKIKSKSYLQYPETFNFIENFKVFRRRC